MGKPGAIYSLSVIAFVTLALFVSLRDKAPNAEEKTAMAENKTSLPQVIKAIDLNRDFDFAGEILPMDNFDVYERLDREILVNAYTHATTLLNLKTAQRYFPLFDRILAANGVPEDFKFLAVAESNFRHGTSSAGAKGIWQFMPTTAKGFGLEITEEVDERMHVEKSTEAACKLLQNYKRRFGTWTLAASAYNFGETRMAKEIAAQQTTSFYEMNLNVETSRYMFRLVAIKEIMTFPDHYGFQLDKNEFYQPLVDYKVVDVNSSITSLADFAKENGTTYRMLKLYNPWLIASKLTVKPGKSYKLKIPA
ncbi:MAG: lytic transglycosylase domain-containing protein [Saprospiraceae bacterium]|nr:lytic transglycosylase domain-containing protein [Saprospiraceae bacterium]